MSRGQHDDLKKTIREMKKPSDLIDGKNWLRHSGQALRIDEMFLTGATKQEIAQELIRKGIFKGDVKKAQARVQRHIDHIRKDDHMLPLETDANGIWQFNINTLDDANIEITPQKQSDDSQNICEIPTREEIIKTLGEIAPEGKEVDEDLLKSGIEVIFKLKNRMLMPGWWEITKRNLTEWSRRK